MRKTLKNTNHDGVKKNVRDIQFAGQHDPFKLIAKAWSESEGWMKSTKAMNVPGGVVIQVTTQQSGGHGYHPDSVAEALCYVPGAEVRQDNMSLDYYLAERRGVRHV